MAKATKIINWIFSPFFLGSFFTIGISILASIYYISAHDPKALDRFPILEEALNLHNLTLDFRMRRRGPRTGSDDIVILTIDEKAIQKYGRWPWPRSLMARLIDEIMVNGAKSVSFDIIFSEKQDALIRSLSKIKNQLQTQAPATGSLIQSIFAKEILDKDHDKVLSSTVEKHSDHLILGAVYDEHTYQPFPFQDYCFQAISKKNGEYEYWDKEDFPIGVLDQTEFIFPEKWEAFILKHLNKLDQKIAHEWLMEKKHPLPQYLAQQGLLPQKESTVRLAQYLIAGDKNSYQERLSSLQLPKTAKLNWKKVSSLIDRLTQVDLQNSMKDENINYCLRFLTDNDELLPTVADNWTSIQKENEVFANTSFVEAKEMVKTKSLANPVHQVSRWLLNIPAIAEHTLHTGTFNATQDKDGSVRRAKLFVRIGNQYMPSLALKTFLVNNNYSAAIKLAANPYEEIEQSKIVQSVEVSDEDGNLIVSIPTDHLGQVPINYAGPQKMFAYLSAGEILGNSETITIEQRIKTANGQWEEEEVVVNKKEYLKNKQFILGATATGIYDLRVTPFEENYPGVETHANFLDNLTRKDFLRTHPEEGKAMTFAILAGGMLFTLIISKLGALTGLIVTLLSLFTLYLIDSLYIFPSGIVINIIFPFFTILFLYTFLTFFKYFTEERKKKQLKGTFQKYVSPAIVNEILKDPSKLELGGVKQEMSVFFSDVRGFTTISERLDPRALSDLLNHYLTPMTEIIFTNKGTLDKYMGDAIMAFFGAPIPSENHASQACRASLQQIEKLFDLQKVYEEQGLPMIDIGIGVNTGDMSVGNMGSSTVRNYTVMGDAVNLGARLEGINKQYGTRIIISEFTRKHIENENFILREIDWVKVKGKSEPVKIYELIMEGTPPKYLADKIDFFNKGFSLYHSRDWNKAIAQFNQALSIDANDKVSQLYITRCKNYLQEPPDKDWDGVFTMTTK